MKRRSIFTIITGFFAARTAAKTEAVRPIEPAKMAVILSDDKPMPGKLRRRHQAILDGDPPHRTEKDDQESKDTFWKAQLFDAIQRLGDQDISFEFNPNTGHTQAVYPKGVMLTKYLWVGHKFWKEQVFISDREPKETLAAIPVAVKLISEKAELMKAWYAENQWAAEKDMKRG